MAEHIPAPEQAGPGRRMAAWAIDFALILGMAALLGSVTHYRIVDYLSGWPGLVYSGGWDLFRANGDWGDAGSAFGWDVFGEILLLIGEAFVALVLSVFAYQFAALAWKGRTLGKLLLGIRVHSITDPGGRLTTWQAARRAVASTVVDVGLYSAACVALLAGEYVLSLVLWVAAVSALVLNAVPLAGGRTAIDRMAGTTVVRAGQYRRSWQAVRDAAILEQGAQGAQLGMERVQAVTDAMKKHAQQLAEDERLRQLRAAAQTAPLRKLGHDVSHQTGTAARQLLDSERGQRAAKRVGANLRAAYGKRRRTRS